MSTAECAPTLAPWRPNNDVTSEAIPHRPSDLVHGIYDINDIVHFEDNDIVMRDSKDHNKLDNSIEYKYNDVKSQLNDNKYFIQKVQLNGDDKNIGVNEIDNDLKGDEAKKGDEVKGKDDCECQHGGGCVAHICLCPLGYAGERCEITLDLKVSVFYFKYF